MDKNPDKKRCSKRLFFIAIGVLVLSAIGIVLFYSSRKTKTVIQPPGPYTLTPKDITTAAGVAQSFTASYPVTGGWQNISDASIYISGSLHDQWVRYNPSKRSFTLQGAAGSCTAGQAAALSTNYLTLNCGASSASGPGDNPMVIFNLTPQPPFSGIQYRLIIIALDQAKKSSGAVAGSWTVK